MAEILDHGQQLDLRTRRGADFELPITLLTEPLPAGVPVDITGSTCVSRIFSAGQPDIVFSAVVAGPTGTITISLSAGQTLAMTQDWQYVMGYKDASGSTRALLFGAFRVSQEAL